MGPLLDVLDLEVKDFPFLTGTHHARYLNRLKEEPVPRIA
jgi:hypothetical protein